MGGERLVRQPIVDDRIGPAGRARHAWISETVIERSTTMAKSLHACFASVLAATCLTFSSPVFADFEEALVPIAVKTLYCDYNPRIVVQFADASKNIWYPANLGDQSKAFLSTALAAKVVSQRLYFLGVGDPASLTTYCINVSARQARVFGLVD
jgi:hypothetical protein